MRLSRYRAVVFDLWGTLVDELTYPEAKRRAYEQKIAHAADLLRVEREVFSKAWSAGVTERMAGRPPSMADALMQICQDSGVEPTNDGIQACIRLRYEFIRDALSPRPGVIETISTLKELGHKVGLISNCGEEVCRLWDTTPFAPLLDFAVLSFAIGLVKPDPQIYRIAAAKLGLAAEHCLYVGDGSDDELTGASDVGMTPVLIRAPYDREDGARQSLDGMRISTIREVRSLLD